MNATIRRREPEIEPHRLLPSAAAQRRLARRLGHERQFDEVLEASALYGVDPQALDEIYAYWLDDFELEQQSLFRLPGFRLQSDHGSLRFWHVRSGNSRALPLLLLHGGSGSLAEFASLAALLAEPASGAVQPFHVVCPALDDASSAASCTELMRSLGYSRYLVHGSDVGAAVALELGARAGAAVAGLHVTSVQAYPSEAAGELAALTSAEKSQLAVLTEWYERGAELPESPLEELACALTQLADSLDESVRWRDALLTGLSLRWASSVAAPRDARHTQLRLAPSCVSAVPLAVHCFPLGTPSLRRFVEARHRVAEWHEHGRGGTCPALEQPELLLASLRTFAARLS